MKIVPSTEYSRYIPCAENIPFCRVFPLSVAEGRQSGCIYESVNIVLIRHRNRFTFISGTPDEAEIHEIHELILSERLKFLCDDTSLAEMLSAYGGVELVPRDIYSYPHDTTPAVRLPEGYSLRMIDAELFHVIKGDVVPTLYWKDYDEYSKNGCGVCVMHGNVPASWAFSSAVSGEECDIGIETAEAFRHGGLALAAAAAAIGDILPHKSPTWTCQRSNRGSARIAEKLGFVKCGECVLIRKPL